MSFNPDEFYLGNVCRRFHYYGDTLVTLRYKKYKHCVTCKKEYYQNKYQPHPLAILTKQERVKAQKDSQNRWYENGGKEVRRKYWKTIEGKRINSSKQSTRRNIYSRTSQKICLEDVLRIWQPVFGNSCVYCGSIKPKTLDHVIPLSNGGLHIIQNLVPCCTSCNSSKSNLELIKWYSSYKFFHPNRLKKILNHLEFLK